MEFFQKLDRELTSCMLQSRFHQNSINLLRMWRNGGLTPETSQQLEHRSEAWLVWFGRSISEHHVPTSISAMRSRSSANSWQQCVHVDVVRTPPTSPGPAGPHSAVREPAQPAGDVARGCSRSKSNMATSRSKSTSIDDEEDTEDELTDTDVEGQTDAQSKSNSDENVRIGGDVDVVVDVRSQPNRSSRMEELVTSSAGRESVRGSPSVRSFVWQGVASARPSSTSSEPGSSSSSDRDRHGVAGPTDRVGSTSHKMPPVASTARRVLRMSTERSNGGSRRRSDRVSGAAVRTLARLSSTSRCRSSWSSARLRDEQNTLVWSSSTASDHDNVLLRFLSWFAVTSHMTPHQACSATPQRLQLMTMSSSSCH